MLLIDLLNAADTILRAFPFFMLFTWLVDRLFIVHRLLANFIDTHFTL